MGSFRGAIPVHKDIYSGRVLRKTAKVGVKLGIWSATDFSSEEVTALQGGQQQPCPRKKPQPHPDGASAVLTSEEKKESKRFTVTLSRPPKDEEGLFKARTKALKGPQKPQKSVKRGSRRLFSCYQKTETPLDRLHKGAESGPNFAASSMGSESLPSGLRKPRPL